MQRIWLERELPAQYIPLLGDVTIAGWAAATPGDPFSALPGAHAIVAGSRYRYDGAVMDRSPELRVIARTGIGYDNIAVADATARGIAVCIAPDAPTISTAEHTITLMLAVARRLKRSDREMHAGQVQDFFSVYSGVELYGRRLGLLGLGRIGSRVAGIAQALGMQVLGYDPYVGDEQVERLGVERAPTVEQVFEEADVVSLHLPLTPQTRHIVDARALAMMRPGAILINCARGGLVDERALLHALEQGRLHGAGLDVWEREPPAPDHPLLGRDDVVATPHIASATGAGKDRLWRSALAQALQVLRGERPPFLVNPEVWPLDTTKDQSFGRRLTGAGKYSHIPGSSDDFMQEKQNEIDHEDRQRE
jgi:D-3-phosphoglycerate dehydrogenase / 2-oxoglutarate reductase